MKLYHPKSITASYLFDFTPYTTSLVYCIVTVVSVKAIWTLRSRENCPFVHTWFFIASWVDGPTCYSKISKPVTWRKSQVTTSSIIVGPVLPQPPAPTCCCKAVASRIWWEGKWCCIFNGAEGILCICTSIFSIWLNAYHVTNTPSAFVVWVWVLLLKFNKEREPGRGAVMFSVLNYLDAFLEPWLYLVAWETTPLSILKLQDSLGIPSN